MRAFESARSASSPSIDHRRKDLRVCRCVLHSDMQTLLIGASTLSDAELLRRIEVLAGRERQATVELIAHLAELDRRKLYRGEGYASLFSYCTRALRLAEQAAYKRIVAARASRRFPVLLDRLASGSLNLSTLCHAYALGGETTMDNLSLRCRSHNVHEAELVFEKQEPRLAN
jgi:hypothetical protein